MTTTPPTVGIEYASGYAKGRHAAKEHIPATDNPFHPRTPEFHGWNDGHYDEQSARIVAMQRHSTAVWANHGAN